MNRRVLIAIVVAGCLVVSSALVALVGSAPAYAASTQQTFLTFYGWYDNTPPGGDISHPKIHSTAGGKGTFADPITFATSTKELAAGSVVWVPRVKKYFIMEDDCEECAADWTGHGPNGGPGLHHLDLWLGGKGGNAFDAINCEDALTHYNADNTPTLEPVVVSPPSNEPVDSTPLFDTSTGACYGGAQSTATVGQYKNGSNGQCIDDPNDSSSTGTALKTAACSGATSQQFTFQGAFLMIHSRCAGMSGSAVVLQTCSGGPAQQWSVNPNGTISDIQTGAKCIRASGTNIVAGSCSGAASQWTFTAASTGGGGTTTTYEAENATIVQGAVATNHTGFTGTGFVDYVNTTGSYVEWTVPATTAGPATVKLRFANGTTTNRPMDIAVDGTVVSAALAFASTGTWDTWQTVTLTVQLAAGTNTIRATATTANGGPNVDSLAVTM